VAGSDEVTADADIEEIVTVDAEVDIAKLCNRTLGTVLEVDCNNAGERMVD